MISVDAVDGTRYFNKCAKLYKSAPISYIINKLCQNYILTYHESIVKRCNIGPAYSSVIKKQLFGLYWYFANSPMWRTDGQSRLPYSI